MRFPRIRRLSAKCRMGDWRGRDGLLAVAGADGDPGRRPRVHAKEGWRTPRKTPPTRDPHGRESSRSAWPDFCLKLTESRCCAYRFGSIMEYPSPRELVLKHGTHAVASAFRRAAKLNVAGGDRAQVKAVLKQIAILQLMRQKAVQFASPSAMVPRPPRSSLEPRGSCGVRAACRSDLTGSGVG